MGEQEKDVNLYNRSVSKLSTGLLENYRTPLQKAQHCLNELTLEQNKVIIQLHDENIGLTEQFYSTELQDFVKKMNVYNAKLLKIKKDMKNLHEKSNRLKMRALKMEQYTEKIKLKQIQKEINLKKEEDLIGPGPRSSPDRAKSESSS